MNIPLYIQASRKELGPIQRMDYETIQWIEQESSELFPISILEVGFLEHDFDLLKKYQPMESWFLSHENINSIHGINHILRVMVHIILICKMENIQPEPLLKAASLHDVRRLNDNQDSGHGMRAAEFFAESLLGMHSKESSENEIIYNAIAYHETDYSHIPLKVLESFKVYIDVIKAADALDRFRQPNQKWWPDPLRIELASARSLLPFSRLLTIQSEKLNLKGLNSYDSITMSVNEILEGK